jgi:hypothetical protein
LVGPEVRHPAHPIHSNARDTAGHLVPTAWDASVDPAAAHLDAGLPAHSEAVRDFRQSAWADAQEPPAVKPGQALPLQDVLPMVAYPVFARDAAQESRPPVFAQGSQLGAL